MKNSFKYSGVFLPIEVMSRELHGKILLAASLAKQTPVFLGHKSEIYKLASKSSSPGILLNKSVGLKNNTKLYQSLRQRGFQLMAQDEEAGTVFSNFGDFFARRSSLRDVPSLDHWFCWGDDEASFLASSMVGMPMERMTVSGSPRSALWGEIGRRFWSEEIENLRNSLKPFVLFASNNVWTNSPLSEKQLLKNRIKMADWDSVGKHIYQEKVEFERLAVKAFLECIESTLEATPLDVVIRPHPAENTALWKDRYRSNPRVTVSNRGPVSPWILSSERVVHYGSTVGLEAALSGVPTAALMPPGYAQDDIVKGVPFWVSEVIHNRVEFLGFLNNSKTCQNSRLEERVHRKIANVGNLTPLKLICDRLSRSFEGRELDDASPFLKSRLQISPLKIKEWARSTRLRPLTKSVRMDRYKRPHLDSSTVELLLARSEKILDLAERLHVKRVDSNSYLIWKSPG
jgi:surface carbohydrate biosynthesis protein